MCTVYILHSEKERLEDAIENMLYGSDNIIHSESVLWVLHTKKEREEDATEYTHWALVI